MLGCGWCLCRAVEPETFQLQYAQFVQASNQLELKTKFLVEEGLQSEVALIEIQIHLIHLGSLIIW